MNMSLHNIQRSRHPEASMLLNEAADADAAAACSNGALKSSTNYTIRSQIKPIFAAPVAQSDRRFARNAFRINAAPAVIALTCCCGRANRCPPGNGGVRAILGDAPVTD